MAPKRGRQHRRQLPVLAVTATAAAIILLVATTPSAQPAKRSVLILDTLPNPDQLSFAEKCRGALGDAGYEVKTYTGGNVTVERIRALSDSPLIILRLHSSVFDDGVWFYTGEPYSNTEHVLEQLANELHIGRTSLDATPTFAVGSSFIRGSLRGRLNGTIVVLMGCDSLDESDLAEAFIDSGASACVGWVGPVSVEQTDEATLGFIHALVGGSTVEKALEAAAHASNGVGFNSTITAYPAGSVDLTLPPP